MKAFLAGTFVMLPAGCNASHISRSNGQMRIVSLTPSVTEALFALGAGPDVVGVSQYCDYPPEVRQLPKIGSFLTPNIEEIAGLRPTLVIGLPNSSDLREIRALQAMGITTLMVEESSVGGIENSIGEIGDHTGRAQAARDVIAQIRREISETEQRLAGTARPRVLMVVGHQPMVAVGQGTYLDELLALAHSQNIADRASQSWPRLSVEYVIASRPEVILDGQMGTDPHAPASFWAKYPSIPAVRNGRVFGYPDDPTLHPGPRVGRTLELLARLIHPDVFEARGPVASEAAR